MSKKSDIFVLEIQAFRGSMCQDVGFWTHASPDLKLLKKFVEEIIGPNRDMGSPFALLKMKINKYTKIKTNGLHQWNGIWLRSSIDDSDIGKCVNNGNSFFMLNDALARLCFAKTEKQIKKCEVRLAKEYEELWKNVDEKFKD